MTTDDLKLARDGWLWEGKRRDMHPIKPLYEVIEVLPNGNVITTCPGGGALEWGPATPTRSPEATDHE